MYKKTKFWARWVSSAVLVAGIAGGLSGAAERHAQPPASSPEFQPIDQPIEYKIAVTLGGLGLIGLELWWFLFSQPKPHPATREDDIQEVTVTVDGGYEPRWVVVQAGKPVRLNFDRKDPSPCLEQVKLTEFHILRDLRLNEVTAVEFLPEQVGNYEFTCGMNMFRGVIEVRA